MPKYQITGPDGKTFEVTAPDGASEQEVLAYAQRNFKLAAAPKPAAKPFGKQLNDFVADVPRQVGLTARYGLEGIGGMLDTLSSPIRAGMNALGANIKPGSGEALSDLVGLPKPASSSERVVGDAARMVAGGLLPIGAGAALTRGATGTAQRVGQVLAAKPAQQLASAGAAGAAGGYTRETGGNDTSQLVASLAAGVAAPFALNGVARGARAAQNLRRPPTPSPADIDIKITQALQPSGLTLDQLPADVVRGMRADVAKAMQIGGNLSEDAVRRLADYRLVGATPTQGTLLRTPAAFTQQKNLAKLGANSSDEQAQLLANVENANNSKLVQVLDNVGGNTADDAYSGGQKILDGVKGYNSRVDSIIGKLYDRARASNGRSAALDPRAFTNRAGDLLNEANVESFLTPDIRNKLNAFASGETPLTVEIAEQFKTSIGGIQRSSADGNVRKALGMVRQALDETPLLPGQEIGGGAQMAFSRARRMNREYMAIVEETPALQAVREGIEPDKFVQQFIVGSGPKSNVMDVAMLKNSIKSNPLAMEAVKEQIALYLKDKALSDKSAEVGRISESALNKAIKAIGERKLNLFFNRDEIDQIRAAGRVASYEQVQPVGSAVNNSNTAAAVGGMVERVFRNMPIASPLVQQYLSKPIQDIQIGIRAGRTLDVPRALTDGVRQPQLRAPRQLALSPAAVLGTEDEETRRRRQQGLLTP